jgi:excinuclease ABC subunit C
MNTREHLREIASQAPLSPGVYLYKDPSGEIIYVGKANNLRARVRSYFSDDRLAEPKTGALISAAAAIDFIVVANPKEALALENELIKRHKPRFNILLRDDKTYPYIKLTAETFPRVYVTRRLLKDGATYFGPYFPGNLAHRLVHFIHRYFKIPSCRVDLTRSHSHPCLEYHIHRCLGPCAGLTTIETYAAAAQNVRYFLEGRLKDLSAELRSRMEAASTDLRFEEAASLRDLLATIEEREEKQRIAAAEGADVDIYAYYAEPPLVAVNLFHLRNGRIVERRDFFWEDQPDFDPPEFFASLIKQVYLSQPYVPALIHIPVDFEERAELEEFLSDKRGRKCEIHTPRRGEKKAMLALAETNARQSFEQRFRVMRPNSKAIQEALRDTLGLEDPPRRIECFDISHFQGEETVASMVVWEDGRMKKSDYRKFLIKTVEGIDDFASMREVVTRRYSRLQEENKPLPGLILIDGGLGQLHAAADALDSLGILNQPLASIAKREEIIYVYGSEDEPIQLDRFSPVLHLIQTVRDEAHRFAITFHRGRRASARMTSELSSVPGVGPKTIAKLLREFGSPDRVRAASEADLARAAGPAAARRLRAFFGQTSPAQPESYTEI